MQQWWHLASIWANLSDILVESILASQGIWNVFLKLLDRTFPKLMQIILGEFSSQGVQLSFNSDLSWKAALKVKVTKQRRCADWLQMKIVSLIYAEK
jgi:hypothetical protein